MTENADLVTGSSASPAEDERAERVLDAAARLLVRLGYRRVTVEDVAREAGVGKGTVYLHFRTKEALFVTVLLRSRRADLLALIEGIRAEPAQALPSRLVGMSYRRTARDPVARAVFLGDPEVFGQLTQEAAGSWRGEFAARRDAAFAEHLRLLREAGLLRADLAPSDQYYLLSAASLGFYLLVPEAVAAVPADAERRAELLEYTLAAALQTGAGVPTPALAAEVAALYEPLIDHLEDEWRRRVR